jgi:uncharacterized PurR-regulated membrane protein YhhQ (DUF165 family)
MKFTSLQYAAMFSLAGLGAIVFAALNLIGQIHAHRLGIPLSIGMIIYGLIFLLFGAFCVREHKSGH